ncbi:MAG: hypothetical protein AAF092_17770 [Pseudomonadota bacterium]
MMKSVDRHRTANNTLSEARKLYSLAEQLNEISNGLDDERKRDELKRVVKEVLGSSRSLSSLSSELSS